MLHELTKPSSSELIERGISNQEMKKHSSTISRFGLIQ